MADWEILDSDTPHTIERKRHAILQAAAIIHAIRGYSDEKTSIDVAETLYKEILSRENKDTTKP